MGSPITETSSFAANVVGPDAGNKVTAASVRVMGKSLADRTKYLYDKIATTAGTHYSLPASTSITRAQQGVWLRSDGAVMMPDAGIFMSGPGGLPAATNAETPIMVPSGATITAVTVHVVPQSHASIASTTLPILRLRKVRASTNVNTLIGEITDPSADAATYNAAHPISLSSLTEVVNRDDYYYIVTLNGETGTNSNGLSYLPVVLVTYSAPYIDDGY